MLSSTPQAISLNPPSPKKKTRVLGSNIAYLDNGPHNLNLNPNPTALIFLHGNPTSSYLWRHIIPLISPQMRCIAPDLLGFGDSDKPASSYRVFEHIQYLDAFLDAVLPSEKLIFVLHDWGSALGFDWARRHEERVAGLAFMEFIPPTDSWSDFTPSFTHLFRQFRDPEIGPKLLIEDNAFLEIVLQRGIVRKLTDDEMNEYRRPFLDPRSRDPILRFPNELPIEGYPEDVWDMATQYMAWLLVSEVPKLLFWTPGGAFIPEVRAKRFLAELRNVRDVCLEPGNHYLQEDHPEIIGREIAAWLPRVVGNL